MTRKTYYNIIRPFRGLYRFFMRPKKEGVKVAIFHNKKLLMVHINYGPKYWTIPGGGVDKGETREEAAQREVKEETGIHIKNLKYIMTYHSKRHFMRSTVYCFAAEAATTNIEPEDPGEIQSVGWFDLDDLPKPCSYAIHEIKDILKKYIK